MILTPTYYQAQCDLCGKVDDGGNFTAWSSPDDALMNAFGSGWEEITSAFPYSDGRSILVCEDHLGEGIGWCRVCEDNLAPDGWVYRFAGNFEQRCPRGHSNSVYPTKIQQEMNKP